MHDASKTERVGRRQRLVATFDGLQRRIMNVQAMISPRTYIANPWLRLAAAAVVGYRLGCPEQTTRRGPVTTVLQAVLRTVLVNVTTSAVRDVVNPDPVVN